MISDDEKQDALDRIDSRSNVNTQTGCLLWTGFSRGYQLPASILGVRADIKALAYRIANDTLPTDMVVRTSCIHGEKLCVEPGHLIAVYRRWRHKNTQLSADTIEEICAAICTGESYRSIGRRFGVSRQTICNINKGKIKRCKNG